MPIDRLTFRREIKCYIDVALITQKINPFIPKFETYIRHRFQEKCISEAVS